MHFFKNLSFSMSVHVGSYFLQVLFAPSSRTCSFIFCATSNLEATTSKQERKSAKSRIKYHVCETSLGGYFCVSET